MSRTAPQQAYIDATLARMKAEIAHDVATGRIPQTVASYGELHNHVDANEYGGMCDDSGHDGPKGLDALGALFPDPEGTPDYGTINSQRGMDVANELQDAANAWIQSGALRALIIHFEGFEFDGMQITNPTASDCSRFQEDPRHYGFEECSTGGGCTGLGKTLEDGTTVLLTDIEGTSHELGEACAPFLVGLSDKDGTILGEWQMEVAITFSNEDDEDAPRNLYLINNLQSEIEQATRQQTEAFRAASQ
jgi:hypothetical protein